MSKSVRSNKWFVRVDGDEAYLRTKCLQLLEQDYTVSLLATYQQGKGEDNPHCHICHITTKVIQKQSYALQIKTIFDSIKERDDYCVKPWDGKDDCLAYLMHESPLIVIANKGYSDEDIESYKKINANVQKIVEKNKEKASCKILMGAMEFFKDIEFKHLCRIKVLLWMLEQCNKGIYHYPGEWQLKKYAEELYIKRADNDALMKLAYTLGEKYGW